MGIKQYEARAIYSKIMQGDNGYIDAWRTHSGKFIRDSGLFTALIFLIEAGF